MFKMKKILFVVICLLYGVAYGQVCADEDTVRSNAVTLITANTVRVNGTVSHFSGAPTSLQLRYVRVGQTDTATSSSVPTTALRNLTGLQAATQYYYYYKTICGSGSVSQTIGAYTFTTLANTVLYAPERPTVFNHLKVDSSFIVPEGDTVVGREPSTRAQIRYKTSDNTFYGYYTDCTCWRALAIDSSGIIGLLDGKVDSVTVSGDSLFYWKVGVSYGYILPSVATVWHTTGNTGIDTSTDFIGTTDNVDFPIKTNNVRRFTVNTSGALGIGATPDYGTSGYVLESAGNAAAPAWTAYTFQKALTAGSTLTGTNTITAASYQQTYQWNTLASGYGMYLSSNSTAAVSGQTLLAISTQGANAAAGRTTYGLSVENTHTGTSSSNYAGYFSASGGSNNYSLYTSAGDVRLNQTSGDMHVGLAGTNTGKINLGGATSGTITIQPQSTAGTFNFNLPTTAGTSGYLLTSAGGGASAMTWTNPASLSTSLTSTYIGYGSAGNAVTGDANLTRTAASGAVALDSGYLSFTGSASYGSTVAGSIFRSSLYGLTQRAVAGASYDWLVFSAAGNSVLGNPTGTDDFVTSSKFGAGLLGTSLTARMDVAASTTSIASIRIRDGVAPSSPNAGDIWKTTDKYYGVINTGTATKEFTLNDIALTSGRVPFATTNGRLTDVSTFTFGSGLLSVPQIKGSGSTPAIAGGVGAGTSPTVSITGTDLAGMITVTTDTDPTNAAVLCTITFATAFGTAPFIQLTPADDDAAMLSFDSGSSVTKQVHVTSTTTTFVINTNGASAPYASTQFKWYYQVIQ